MLRDGAPIILASDQHPRQITAKLTDEHGHPISPSAGWSAEEKLEAPDPLTRRAILKAKAAARGGDRPRTVLAYVADHLRASVRELEEPWHTF